MAVRTLDITCLEKQCALSDGARLILVESARVALAEHEHPQPCDGTWDRSGEKEPIQIIWHLPDQTMIQSHANEYKRTEHGAEALAISAMYALGYEVQGRTGQGSGNDWWMIRPDDEEEIMYLLEVSGIRERGAPGARLGEKFEQGRKGSRGSPGFAVVFRFGDAKLLSEAWS